MEYTLHTPDSFGDELITKLSATERHWRKAGMDSLHEMARIAHSEAAKTPTSYIRFGVYWWALKRVLIEKGLLPDGMTADDAMLRGIYSGSDDAKTVMLAFMFRDWHDATKFASCRETVVNDNGEGYVLLDPDMEIPM